MQIISSIIVGIAVLWFANANRSVVTVRLFVRDVDASLALVIGITFFVGFIIGVTWIVPWLWRLRVSAKKSSAALDAANKERDKLKERSEALESQMRQLSTNNNSSSQEESKSTN